MLLPRQTLAPTVFDCIIGVICLCIVMYALGTTMTLWDLQLELDPVNAPLLEGFSLPATLVDLRPTISNVSLHEIPPFLRMQPKEESLFRPPISLHL